MIVKPVFLSPDGSNRRVVEMKNLHGKAGIRITHEVKNAVRKICV